MFSATSLASISGLRISTMLRLTSLPVILARSARSFSMSAPFLPMTTPGPRGVDGDARLLGRPLDDDAADAGLGQALLQKLAQAQILVQQVCIVLVGEPARIPGAVDAEAQPDRIDLLAHLGLLSSRSRTTTVRLRHGFSMRAAAAAAAGVEALHDEGRGRPSPPRRTAGRHRADGCSRHWRSPPAAPSSPRGRCGGGEKVSSASAVPASLPRISCGHQVELARAGAEQRARRPWPRCRPQPARLRLLAHFASTFFAFLSAAVWP